MSRQFNMKGLQKSQTQMTWTKCCRHILQNFQTEKKEKKIGRTLPTSALCQSGFAFPILINPIHRSKKSNFSRSQSLIRIGCLPLTLHLQNTGGTLKQ